MIIGYGDAGKQARAGLNLTHAGGAYGSAGSLFKGFQDLVAIKDIGGGNEFPAIKGLFPAQLGHGDGFGIVFQFGPVLFEVHVGKSTEERSAEGLTDKKNFGRYAAIKAFRGVGRAKDVIGPTKSGGELGADCPKVCWKRKLP